MFDASMYMVRAVMKSFDYITWLGFRS